jgi:hypothetical protein
MRTILSIGTIDKKNLKNIYLSNNNNPNFVSKQQKNEIKQYLSKESTS